MSKRTRTLLWTLCMAALSVFVAYAVIGLEFERRTGKLVRDCEQSLEDDTHKCVIIVVPALKE